MVTGQSVPMRLVLVVTAYLLVLMLASSSPIGTGRGAHRDALLDPLFPHLHPGAPTEQAYGAGDGTWRLAGNEIALPGDWHAAVVVRRANVVDDAQASFDFTIDPGSGTPRFS